jgi:hypothetical protein
MSCFVHQAAGASACVDRGGGSERRQGPRFEALGEVARIDALGVVGLGRLGNLSNGGAMLITSAPLEAGGPIRISFDCTNSVQGRIAWQSRGRLGIRFLEPIECVALMAKVVRDRLGKAVRAPRLPVNYSGHVKCAGASFPTIIGNMSEKGMKICHGGNLQTGARLEVRLEQGMSVTGTVRWSDGYFAGVELSRTIDAEELANARRFQRGREAPRASAA